MIPASGRVFFSSSYHFFFFHFSVGVLIVITNQIFSACREPNQNTLFLSWCGGHYNMKKHAKVSTDHLSLMGFYRLEQVKPKQTAGSALQRSALNTCVCVMVHTTDCIIHHKAKTGMYVNVRPSVFVLKCLCLSLIRRSEAAGRHGPPFCPLGHTGRSAANMQEERQEDGREEAHQRGRQDPMFLIQLLGSQGYFTPPRPPPALLSSGAVIRKGRSKGVAECHCNVLALRAARVWPRVAL